MNIALIGYGKMGKVIEELAIGKGHRIVLTSDSGHKVHADDLKASGAEVAIEFTLPDAAVDNIFACFDAGVPVVVGTTGWYTRLPEVEQRCSESNGTLFYASNFSIGMNVLFHMNKLLAEAMDRLPEYEAYISETHHIHKKDAPSGTAITLAEDLINHLGRYKDWKDQFESGQKELGVISHRIEDVPGTHEVIYRSEIDEIKLEHRAFSRIGFALGALHAAEWLPGKKGSYTMRHLLKL